MNKEVFFSDNQFIISKTDTKGRITYCNALFVEMSGYSALELIAQPHSILRHSDMPKIIFKILWDELQAGREIFAFVKNKTKQGDYYWVIAFVTPSYDTKENVVEYFSVRRKPDVQTIKNIIEPLYKELLSLEKNGGLSASQNHLNSLLHKKGISYEQFIFSL